MMARPGKKPVISDHVFTPVVRPWSGGRVTSGRAAEALDAFAGRGVSVDDSSDVVEESFSVSDYLQENAGRTFTRNRVTNVMDRIFDRDKPLEVFTQSSFEEEFRVRDVGRLIYHPAFIRSAARRGSVFYIDSKGKIRRQSVKGKVEVSKTVKFDPSGVDRNFYLKPKWYDQLMSFVQANMRVLLIGPSGVGKSEAIHRIFEELDRRLLVVSCNPSMIADDFEGRIDLRESAGGVTETVFTPASPMIALEKGYGLLLDESDAVSPEACFALYRILDGRSMHVLRKGYDGVVEPHPDFRVVGTQNTEGRGDDMGLFHGRSFQDESMLDRWSCYIKTPYPTKDEEVTILRKRTGVVEEGAVHVQEAARRMRNTLEAGKMVMSVSMRRTQNVCHNIVAGMSPWDAWSFGVLNRATREDAATIKEFLKRVYGSNLSKVGAV